MTQSRINDDFTVQWITGNKTFDELEIIQDPARHISTYNLTIKSTFMMNFVTKNDHFTMFTAICLIQFCWCLYYYCNVRDVRLCLWFTHFSLNQGPGQTVSDNSHANSQRRWTSSEYEIFLTSNKSKVAQSSWKLPNLKTWPPYKRK